MRAAREWLQASSNGSSSGKCTAAGQDLAAVLKQVATVLAAQEAVRRQVQLDGVTAAATMPTATTSAYVAVCKEFAQQLREFGVVATSLVVPNFCNNPDCSNLTGASEAALVSAGRSSRRGECKKARYCSRACQELHWKVHKPVCKAIAAASAAK